MALYDSLLVERWGSGEHIGDAKPTMDVKVRKGHFTRTYDGTPWNWRDVRAVIAGGNNLKPWQATWNPTTAYKDIPSVMETSFEQSLDNNGITTATITIENIVYPELTGPQGIYHVIRRGYMAPFRGYSRPGFPGWQEYEDEWSQLLVRNAQITVWQGYGDDTTRTFTGLIDDVDLTSHPDRIIVTARDFGQVLTDQHVFGYVKDPACHDPITFIDKLQADKTKKVGYDAKAGTEDDGPHAAKLVLDTDSSTFWRSHSYSGPNSTDWIEIHLPQGRYDSFYMFNEYPGMTGYLSLYARPRTDGKPCTFDGAVVADNDWIDTGEGTVPGALGGKPYVLKWDNMPDDRGYTHTFGFSGSNYPREFECGPGSVIRVHFRDLYNPKKGERFYAGVKRMIALKRSLSAEAKKHKWIIVEDAADIVRVCLRWAGFKTWEVENTGTRLSKPFVVDRSMTLMDVIKQVMENTDFLFYIADPRDEFDQDMGVPVFRHINAVRDDAPEFIINENNLLTGIQAKISEEPLSSVIRMRGAPMADDLDSEKVSNKHVHYTFKPPWYESLAGVLKHVVHNDTKLKTVEDCQFACYYTALQEALESCTGTIEIPGWPGLELDQFAGLFDMGTGLLSRLWVSNRSSTFHTGEQASWKTSLGGSFVDTPDIQAMVQIINAAKREGEP